MDAQPWEEALDLDDSDLPSLLRPCKQLRATSFAAAADTASAPSQSSFALPPEENRHEQPQPSTSRHRAAIPGPAGAVQAAMLRKNRDRANNMFSHNRDGSRQEFNGNCQAISTQDYIRRAVEDTAEFDDDFARHPWLLALQFLGAENGVVPSTPISSMKKCLNVGRVAQVVAVMKSCTPNGLGGLIVSLKDPTGTIGASIHHKVLSESEFGKSLTTGAVLILQEVALFAPVRSAHYLNITLKNLVKVFCQDSGSTSILNNAALPLRYADPGIGMQERLIYQLTLLSQNVIPAEITEHCENAKRSLKMPDMQNVTMEVIDQGQGSRQAEDVQNLNVFQRQTLSNRSFQPDNGARRVITAVDCNTIPEDTFGTRNAINHQESSHNEARRDITTGASNTIPEDTFGTRNAVNHLELPVNGSYKGAERGDLEGSLSVNAKNTTNSATEDTCEVGVNEAQPQMQRQAVIMKASLPQWTDEQLDELFAGDEDGSSCLF